MKSDLSDLLSSLGNFMISHTLWVPHIWVPIEESLVIKGEVNRKSAVGGSVGWGGHSHGLVSAALIH